MFTYSPTDSIIPSLTFTKAELVYIVSIVLSDLKPTDTHTIIEMVEMRHYINKIQDKVLMAAHDGTLSKCDLSVQKEEKNETEEKEEETQVKIPTFEELKQKFPNLSEEEIREVIDKIKTARLNDIVRSIEEEDALGEPSSQSSGAPSDRRYIKKPTDGIKVTEKMKNDNLIAEKFSTLLGT